MSTVVPTISGPKRPQDKVLLSDSSLNFKKVFKDYRTGTLKKEYRISSKKCKDCKKKRKIQYRLFNSR